MSTLRLPALSPRWSAVVAGAVVAALAVGAAVFVGTSTRERAALVFADRTEDAREAISRRLDAYTEALYAGHGLVAGSELLTRAEFHRFVEHLDIPQRYPGIQVLGRAERVTHEDLGGFVTAVREDTWHSGLPYALFEPHPEGPRDEYVIIDYTEPQAGNERAFGLDFLSEPNRRDAVERARDTGRLAATAPITLVQETGSQRAFLMMLADYDAPFPPSTVEGRRQAFIAVEYAAFRMGDLMDGVLSRADAFGLEVYDVGPSDTSPPLQPTPDELMYSLAGTTYAIDGSSEGKLTSVLPLDVGGRRWALHFHSIGPGTTPLETALPWIVLGVGLLIAAMAGWLTFSTMKSRERALRLAEVMTDDLRRSEQELSQSNAELERFAYVASHDLQEPIRTITNFVGLLQRRYEGRLDDKADQYIEFAVDAASRMSTLINDLLAFSRVGRQDRDADIVDLDEVWTGVVADHRAIITEAEAVVGSAPLPTVVADRVYMNQLFANLLGNAIKYGAQTVMVDAQTTQAGWVISVQDDGIGIHPDHHERIFEMFQRLHTRTEYPGTGMGLAICRKIIEGYGGTISVVSGEGEGSTFTIFLPASMAPHARTGSDRKILA